METLRSNPNKPIYTERGKDGNLRSNKIKTPA